MYKIVTSFDGSQCVRCDKENGIVLLIPSDPANTEYKAYLAWVAEGNTATEWQPEA